MRVVSVGAAFPPNYCDQEQLLAAFREHWGGRYFNLARLEQLHRNVRVGGRHLALPIDDYPKLSGFGAANDACLRFLADLLAVSRARLSIVRGEKARHKLICIADASSEQLHANLQGLFPDLGL